MYSIANCTVSILRGTDDNAYGDAVDAGETAPIAVAVPAQILESTRTSTDPSTQTPRTIRRVEARLPSQLHLEVTDRLRQDQTGAVYSIQELVAPQTFGFTSDWEAILRQIN